MDSERLSEVLVKTPKPYFLETNNPDERNIKKVVNHFRSFFSLSVAQYFPAGLY